MDSQPCAKLTYTYQNAQKCIQTADFKGRRYSHDGVELEVPPLVHTQRAVVVFALAPPRTAPAKDRPKMEITGFPFPLNSQTDSLACLGTLNLPLDARE